MGLAGKSVQWKQDPCNEDRVPCNDNRKTSQGKPCFHYRDEFEVYGYSLVQSIRPLQKYFDPTVPDIHGLMKIARHAWSRQADYVILFKDNFNWHIQLSDFVSNGLHEIGKLSVNVTPFFWLYFKMSDPKKDFQHIRLEFEVGLVEKPLLLKNTTKE